MSRLTEIAPFREGETAASNCSRIAAACGYESASAFATVSGFSFKHLADGRRSDIRRFACTIDRPADYVDRGAIRSEARIVSLSGERLLSRQMYRSSLRFCPACLVEDELSGAGRRGFRRYGRMNWQVLAVRACPIHRVELTAPDVRAGFKFNSDFSALLTMMPQAVEAHVSDARTFMPDRLQGYVEDRLASRRDGTLWPDQMPLHDVVTLGEVIGAVSRHGFDYRSNLLGIEEWSRCATAGFELLEAGEDSFKEFVYSLLKRNYVLRKNATRRSLLGRLHDLLYFSVEDFDGIARRIIREAMAEADREVIARGVVGGSRMVSVRAAADRFGVDRLRLKKLLHEGTVISADQMSDFPNRIIVDEAIAERYAAELKRTLDRKEARSHLGASPMVFNALVSAGRLTPVGWKSAETPGGRSFTRFLVAEVDAILLRIQQLATVEIMSGDMVSIPFVAREAGSSFHEVLDFLLEGKLTKVQMIARGGTFQDIRLDVDEVRSVTIKADHGFMSVKAAARKMMAPAKVVAAMVKSGRMAASRKRNPDTGRMSDFLPPDVFEKFSGEYVTLNRLAEHLNVSKPKLRKELASENLEAAFVILETPFYRWSEVPSD